MLHMHFWRIAIYYVTSSCHKIIYDVFGEYDKCYLDKINLEIHCDNFIA